MLAELKQHGCEPVSPIVPTAVGCQASIQNLRWRSPVPDRAQRSLSPEVHGVAKVSACISPLLIGCCLVSLNEGHAATPNAQKEDFSSVTITILILFSVLAAARATGALEFWGESNLMDGDELRVSTMAALLFVRPTSVSKARLSKRLLPQLLASSSFQCPACRRKAEDKAGAGLKGLSTIAGAFEIASALAFRRLHTNHREFAFHE